MSKTTPLCLLKSNSGSETLLGYDFQSNFEALARRSEADVVIVSTEEGFSPLGASRTFFEDDLGISYDEEIYPLANWNRFENERVTLIALASRRPGSLLRGIILAPGENCRSYSQFSSAHGHRPHRSYYYNVSYEAIQYACRTWGAECLAMAHLCSCNRFHVDMATCHAESLAHFCDEWPTSAPKSFTFSGCCIDPDHFKGLQSLNGEGQSTSHRSIKVTTESRGQALLLHLDWKSPTIALMQQPVAK